jgi:hypothetical protein
MTLMIVPNPQVGLGRPGANVIKLFSPQFTNFLNKLECLSLQVFPAYCKPLQTRTEPIRMDHLKGTPL